ncbi:MAG TPA: Ig-like domain-containing protein [Hyalangium sp.]|nr:Ig-like domain-containing protein [Hyalangium sp.]
MQDSPLVGEVGSVEDAFSLAAVSTAVFDATLGAPKCGTVAGGCDSAALLKGRGAMGPEAHAPNTLHGSCADGDYGTYLLDESLEGLKVSTVDGTNLAPGKQVHIDAQVWVYSEFYDSLDLYSAANANSPSWVLLATLQPTQSGLQTLRTTYTLPTGSLQAIRGVFRSTPGGTACATGAFDDHDDLVFAVGTGSSDTTLPTTSLTAPAAGATLTGTVTVSANASDNVGVTRVEFYAGSTLIGTDTSAPYSISWNTTGVANGSYSLTSRAYDAAGNVGTSAARTVTVSNTGGACSTTQQLLANPGFESGNTGWTTSANVIGSSATESRTGSWRALLGGRGLNISYTLEQQVTIPAAACTATLRFWLKVTTTEDPTAAAWDTMQVQILDSTGLLLETLATYSNLDAGSGYVQRSFNLSAYKGRTIRVSLPAQEDVYFTTRFFVDDTALTITR